MYAKVLKQDLFCEAYIYIYSGNVWLPHNKYGEKLHTQRSIYSEVTNETMIKWVADKDVNVELGKPVFERRIEYPLVVEGIGYIWIMNDHKNGIAIHKGTNRIESSANTATQLLDSGEDKVLKGREKELVLCGLNLKQLVSVHCG